MHKAMVKANYRAASFERSDVFAAAYARTVKQLEDKRPKHNQKRRKSKSHKEFEQKASFDVLIVFVKIDLILMSDRHYVSILLLAVRLGSNVKRFFHKLNQITNYSVQITNAA